LLELEFANCSGISFDNAATMAGFYGGVQRVLRNMNGKASSIPCSNHRLNLRGFMRQEAAGTSYITFLLLWHKRGQGNNQGSHSSQISSIQ